MGNYESVDVTFGAEDDVGEEDSVEQLEKIKTWVDNNVKEETKSIISHYAIKGGRV